MTLPVLKIGVLGHTNTGKTSLLRTLLRRTDFGEVSDAPGTTRHVEGVELRVNGEPAVQLYDTPGLEEPGALLERLDEIERQASRRLVGAQRIERFLESNEAQERFAQEAKALRQFLLCDVGLYVIDARQRVLGKFSDELRILADCGRPVVPVLNFTADPDARLDDWRTGLKRAGLHAIASFDTVVTDEDAERELYEKIRTLLDEFAPTLDALIEDRRAERQRHIWAAAELIADLLIDAAACQFSVPATETDRIEQARERLKERIRDRERQCVRELLELFGFSPDDKPPTELIVEGGRWREELFDPETARRFGAATGGGIGVGAGIGLAADVALGGLSLGTGTAIGAVIGGATGGAANRRRQLLDRFRGVVRIVADDKTLQTLAGRQYWLVRERLLKRGHAVERPITGTRQRDEVWTPAENPLGHRLPPPLRDARTHPAWSTLTEGPSATFVRRRGEAVRDLAEGLERQLTEEA